MSATMYGSTPGAGTGQAIFTDDVSLQVFMEHLKRLVSRYYAFSRVNSQCADISFFPRPLARRRIDFLFFFSRRLDRPRFVPYIIFRL
jgi:hypothetical protein